MSKKENVPASLNIVNILAAGTKVGGNVSVESDFRLDGEVEGNITGKSKVVIGENGLLRGELVCLNAEILGVVEGSIVTKECLTLRASARIKGDVKVRTLIVEAGAQFNGSCSMRENTPEIEIAREKK